MNFEKAFEEHKTHDVFIPRNPMWIWRSRTTKLVWYNTITGEEIPFVMADITSINWELFEEPKETLSDKIQAGTINHREGNYKEFVEIKDIDNFLDKITSQFKYCKHIADAIRLVYDEAGEKFKTE